MGVQGGFEDAECEDEEVQEEASHVRSEDVVLEFGVQDALCCVGGVLCAFARGVVKGGDVGLEVRGISADVPVVGELRIILCSLRGCVFSYVVVAVEIVLPSNIYTTKNADILTIVHEVNHDTNFVLDCANSFVVSA